MRGSLGKTAVIIGAGPAGLTAALELLRRSDVKPIILEASGEIGGISRTIKYKGNRMDIGGHRFIFQERPRDAVVDGLDAAGACGRADGHCGRGDAGCAGDQLSGKEARRDGSGAFARRASAARILGPLRHHPETGRPAIEQVEDGDDAQLAAEVAETVEVRAPADPDLVMLIRPRKSRIYYLRKFFDYPIKLTAGTLENLGVARTVRVGASYMKSRVSQIRPEKSRRRLSNQPVRPGALSDVLQELHGEGVGDAVRQDIG